MGLKIIEQFSKDKKIWEIELTGDLDIHSIAEFKKRILEIYNKEKGDLYFLCDNLEYIDSSGLGALIELYKNINSDNFKIKILKANRSVQKIFKITELDKLFNMEEK